MPPIHLGRPGGAPAVIFNPALANLQKHLDHLDQVPVSRAEVDRATKYLQCAVTFYKDESLRQDAIKELVDGAIGEKDTWGLLLDWARPNVFLSSRTKMRNPSYHQVPSVSREKFKRFREFCNFPIVLIGATANRLEISVAVFVGLIYVTKLLTLDLSLGFHASDNIIHLARVFGALSRCRADLKYYYDVVKNLTSPQLSCLYPNPTLIDPFKASPKLTYRQFLSRAGQPTSALADLGNMTTAMYIATLNKTNDEVIVKFTARYNKVAHRLLAEAEAELALRLHFCERVIGNLYMVVMEHVDGKSIWQLQQDKIPVPVLVSQRVGDAVHLLHKNDIVFGDLRDPNILYNESKDRVVLVDFNWAGKDGESRYPATLNPDNVWEEEVSPYSVMRKAHDLWQLDRLVALCNSNA